MSTFEFSDKPTHCPGETDPRCQGICTKHAVTGQILDPDCFRAAADSAEDTK